MNKGVFHFNSNGMEWNHLYYIFYGTVAGVNVTYSHGENVYIFDLILLQVFTFPQIRGKFSAD